MPVRYVPATRAPTHLGAFRHATTPASEVPVGVPFLPTFVSGYNFAVMLGFGVDPSADPSTYTLTDVTLDVRQPTPPESAINIVRGRLDEQSTTMPAECRLTLDNRSGNYSTRRPQSIYYPNVRTGMALKVVIATAADTFEQFSGWVDEWDPGWDTTGNYAIVDVVAHGTWQRLQQITDALASAMYTAITSSQPVAYWSMEDASNATQLASSVLGVPNLAVTSGTITYASVTGPAGSNSLPDFSAGASSAVNLPPVVSTSWRVEFVVQILTDSALADNPSIIEWTATGGTTRWQVYAGPVGFGLSLIRTTSSGTTGYNTSGGGGPINDGALHHVRVDVTTNGSTHAFTVYMDNVAVMSDTGLSGTLGVPKRLYVNRGSVSGGAASTEFSTIGHVAFYAPFVGTVNTYQAYLGFSGETAAARMARLCLQASVPFMLSGTDGGRTMGPQSVDTLYNLLRECEAIGAGVLEDGVNFGLRYTELESRYNQTATMTPTLNQLEPPLAPVESNQRIRNDVIASRPTGTFARYAQPAGLPYATTGPGAVKAYTTPLTFNVDTDGVLYPHASWEVYKGTVDADRYAQLNLNLAARTALIPSWLACANGSRITVASTYGTGGQPPDVLLEGWTLALSTFIFGVSANCSPALPYNLAITDSATTARVGSSDTTLAADIDAAVTSFTVAYTYAWSASAGDYPFDIVIGGEQMTLTSVAGTTFNVTRGVGYGGYTSVHHANDPVTLFRPAVAAL